VVNRKVASSSSSSNHNNNVGAGFHGNNDNGRGQQQRFRNPRKMVQQSPESEEASSSSSSAPPPHVFWSSDFCDHRGMQVVFLGTSSSMPTISRNTSCIALRLDGTIYMFDCGEGVQRQLHRTPFRQKSIDSIFITHMHGDHIFGLPGLLCMIGMTASPSKRPIEIFGPEGLRQWIRTTLKLCHAQIPIKYVVHELVLQEEKAWKRAAKWNVIEEKHQDELSGNDIICSKDGLWHVHEDEKYVVVAGLLKHTIPCWGYVVQERPHAGRFNVERAMEAGVRPGPMYAMLQQGRDVTLRDGTVVKSADVVGPQRQGRKVVILGDTSDSRSLLVAARGADVVVHEATVTEHEADFAVDRGHSTASMAGRFARSIDANTLVLTHFSGKLEGAYYGTSDNGTIKDLITAASKSFGKNSVIAAHDLTAVTICRKEDPAFPAHRTTSSFST